MPYADQPFKVTSHGGPSDLYRTLQDRELASQGPGALHTASLGHPGTHADVQDLDRFVEKTLRE
jgi:hypothetical protein